MLRQDTVHDVGVQVRAGHSAQAIRQELARVYPAEDIEDALEALGVHATYQKPTHHTHTFFARLLLILVVAVAIGIIAASVTVFIFKDTAVPLSPISDTSVSKQMPQEYPSRSASSSAQSSSASSSSPQSFSESSSAPSASSGSSDSPSSSKQQVQIETAAQGNSGPGFIPAPQTPPVQISLEPARMSPATSTQVSPFKECETYEDPSNPQAVSCRIGIARTLSGPSVCNKDSGVYRDLARYDTCSRAFYELAKQNEALFASSESSASS